jgi:hypothetical protein
MHNKSMGVFTGRFAVKWPCFLQQGGSEMNVYMVERDLKGISMESLAGAQKAAIGKAAEMTESGTPVKYIRSTFAPEDGRCMCLFEAGSDAVVKRLNDEAGLPYSRIIPALDLTP